MHAADIQDAGGTGDLLKHIQAVMLYEERGKKDPEKGTVRPELDAFKQVSGKIRQLALEHASSAMRLREV